jgi:hypothetical protein
MPLSAAADPRSFDAKSPMRSSSRPTLSSRRAHRVLGMFAAEEAASMPKKARKHVMRKTVLRLPDLNHVKTSVFNSLSSPPTRRNYKFAMEQFIDWYCSEPRLALNRDSRAPLPPTPRIARISRRNDQSEACGGQKAGLRSGRTRV